MEEEGSRGTPLESSLSGLPSYEDALQALESVGGSKSQIKRVLEQLSNFRLDERGALALTKYLHWDDKEIQRRAFHILGQIDSSSMEEGALSSIGHALVQAAGASPQLFVQSLLALSSLSLAGDGLVRHLKTLVDAVFGDKEYLKDLSAKTGFFSSKGNVNCKMMTHALALAAVGNRLLDSPGVDATSFCEHILDSVVKSRDILSARFAVHALGTVLRKVPPDDAVHMLSDRRRQLGEYLHTCIHNFCTMPEKDRKKKKNLNPFMEDSMARVDLIRLCSIVCFELPSTAALRRLFLEILQLLTKDQDARVFSAALSALCHDRADPRLLWENTRLIGGNVLGLAHIRLSLWDRHPGQMFQHRICKTSAMLASHCITKSASLDINPANVAKLGFSQEPQDAAASSSSRAPPAASTSAAASAEEARPSSASAGDFFDELFAQGEFSPSGPGASSADVFGGGASDRNVAESFSRASMDQRRPASPSAGGSSSSSTAASSALARRLGEDLYSQLSLLKSVTRKFVDSPDIHVRLQAIQVQCWIAEPRELFSLVQGRLAKEVPSTPGWKACHVDAILSVLRDRACCQLDTLPFLLEAIVICHARASPQCIVDCLSTFLQVDQGRPVLQTVFHILDQPRFDQEGAITSVDYTAIAEALYWFLGEYANTLAKTNMDEEPPNAATLSTQDRFMQQNTVMAGFAAKTMEVHPSRLLDVPNACLKSILLRLEQASTFSPQEVRCTCVQALAKIGLRSQDPVRLHVYEILLLLSNDSFLGLSAYTLPVLHLLDDIYDFQSKLLAAEFKSSGGLSRGDVESFSEQHDLLRERVSFFASIPESFSVLGAASRQLIAL